MDLGKLVVWLLKIVAVSAAAGALPLGLFGLWVAGWQGLLNGAMLGAGIGVVAGVSAAGLLKLAYWSSLSRRAGEARWERWFE